MADTPTPNETPTPDPTPAPEPTPTPDPTPAPAQTPIQSVTTQVTVTTEAKSGGGLGTAALVLGILGFIFVFIPCANFLSFLFGLLAAILGGCSIKRGTGKAGLILGIITIILACFWIFVFLGAAASV